MTVQDKNTKETSAFLRLTIVALIVMVVAIGLGFFTSYLADVTSAAPEKSMKEVIAGLGTVVFGIFTAIVAGGSLLAFGIMMGGIADPKMLKD